MPWEILNIHKTNETNNNYKRKSIKLNHLISKIIHSANIPNLCNIFYRVSAHMYVKVVARQKVSVKCAEFNNLYKLLTFFLVYCRLQFVAHVCLLNFMKLQPQQLQAPGVSCICICIFMQFIDISAYCTQSKIKKRKKNQPGDLHTSSYDCRLKIKYYKSCYKYS